MKEKKPVKKQLTTIQKIGNVFVPIPIIVTLFIGIGSLFAAKGHVLDAVINNQRLIGIGLGIIIMFVVYMIWAIVHELRQ